MADQNIETAIKTVVRVIAPVMTLQDVERLSLDIAKIIKDSQVPEGAKVRTIEVSGFHDNAFGGIHYRVTYHTQQGSRPIDFHRHSCYTQRGLDEYQ